MIYFMIAIYDSKKEASSTLYKDFFREEYTLNYLIGTLQTPHIALLNGITSKSQKKKTTNRDK
jgi:enoyl-CoA hydratase/carnithine racemase